MTEAAGSSREPPIRSADWRAVRYRMRGTFTPRPRPEAPCPATVHNLSAGGVYLTTRLNAAVGRRLAFSFHETGVPIPLVASILRVERELSERDPALAGYGCRFTDMAAREESLLRGYIFQREREMHK